MMRWLKSRAPVLFEDKMPVWLTIFASLMAALLTYCAAPYYTRQIQYEDVRSGHLVTTTGLLNEEIISLSQTIRKFDTALLKKDNEEAVELREKALDDIVKLQWRLVDLQVILVDQGDAQKVTALSDALDNLRNSLNSSNDENYRANVDDSMSALATATRDVLNQLYAKASIQG